MRPLLLFLFLLPCLAQAELVYYKDEAGNLHAADSIDQIPEKYRTKTKSLDGGGPEQSMNIKLEREGNSLLIPVSVGGVPCIMVLDTGASITMISKRVAGILKLPEVEKAQIHTASGVENTYLVEAPDVTVRSFRVKRLKVAVHDLPGGGKIEGLLGLDYLNHFRMTLDSATGMLHLERK